MNYTVAQHPDHQRLYHITIDADAAATFVREVADLSEQRLTYVPYLRMIAADCLQNIVGGDFFEHINADG